MRYSHRIDWSGKDATGWLHTRFTSLSCPCRSRSWPDLPSFPARSDALKWEQRWSTTICELGCEVERIQLRFIQWNAHWIWNKYRMGLLNSENEDVTNVISESSNPYTSLKFQLIRWKRSGAWTWPMSPPSTSDITCNQHCSLFPFHAEACSLSVFSNTTKSVIY